MDTQQPAEVEYELLIGGRLTWFATSISPMDAESTLWVARDVTGRKQAEEALQESEARYRAVAESANDAIISSDSRGHIVSWNRAAEAIFGYAAAEAMGQSVGLIMPADFQRAFAAGMTRRSAGARGSGE